MTIFTNASHEYGIRGLREPSHLFGRDRWEADKTEPFLSRIGKNLTQAESGASHLHSVGSSPEIVWLDPADDQWKHLTCHYCGETIQHVSWGWYHTPDGAGWTWPREQDKVKKIVERALWCPGTITGTTAATPVAPVACPPPRTSQQTLTALLDYVIPEPGEWDRTNLGRPVEAYLRDRYSALRESGRVFAGENEPTRQQHNEERHLAGEHFGTVMWRRNITEPVFGRVGVHTSLERTRLRDLLALAAQDSCEGCCAR